MKKKLLATIIVILFISSTYVAYAFVNNNPIINSIGIKVIDNQIVYNGRVLTSTQDIKWFPKLSPDGTKIAFGYDMDFTKDKWGKIGIIDIQSGKIADIYSNDNFANSYMDIEWITDSKIGAVGHRNPTLNTYEIFDLNEMKYIKSYLGIGFEWDKTKNQIFYTRQMPIFSGIRGNSKIMTDDETILFETDDKTVISGGPSISNNNDKIAFFETDLELDNIYLITTDLGSDKKLKNERKIKWDKGWGKIFWLDNKNIRIESRFMKIEFNLDTENVTSTSEVKNDAIMKIDDAKGKKFTEPFVLGN